VLRDATAFVVACYLTSLLDDTFFCGKDVSVQWSHEDRSCSVFYALEPYILNLSLGLTCYLVVHAISALLFYNKILEITLSVLGILSSGSLPILTGVVRFICLKEGTSQENLVYKCDCFDYTIRQALMFVLSRYP
jgi:hypothetical protein